MCLLGVLSLGMSPVPLQLGTVDSAGCECESCPANEVGPDTRYPLKQQLPCSPSLPHDAIYSINPTSSPERGKNKTRKTWKQLTAQCNHIFIKYSDEFWELSKQLWGAFFCKLWKQLTRVLLFSISQKKWSACKKRWLISFWPSFASCSRGGIYSFPLLKWSWLRTIRPTVNYIIAVLDLTDGFLKLFYVGINILNLDSFTQKEVELLRRRWVVLSITLTLFFPGTIQSLKIT